MIEVVERTHADIQWSFSKEPFVLVGADGKRSETVDPHPAQAHDVALVRRLAQQAHRCFPVPFPVSITVSHYESISRTNGWTSVDSDYTQDKGPDGKYLLIGRIFFSGKRIAIHPAVTRYLVPHEYGHVVEEHLTRVLGLEPGELLRDYAKMRGLETPREYSGRTHSLSPSEVFANDFRILICHEAESEYWPHAIDYPTRVQVVRDWWGERLAEMNDGQEVAAA